jgi:hypothetical protein
VGLHIEEEENMDMRAEEDIAIKEEVRLMIHCNTMK